MDPSNSKPIAEVLKGLLNHEKDPAVSVLITVLDAHLVFQEEALSKDVFKPFFERRWPRVSLDQTLRELSEKGFLETTAGADYAVPKACRRELADQLETLLWDEPVLLPGKSIGHQALLKDFVAFARSEQQQVSEAGAEKRQWGGEVYESDGRIHHLLFRPVLLRVKPLSEEYLLICTEIPEPLAKAFSEEFVRNRASQQRLALMDLDKAYKMNLTKSRVFFYFERYLKRALGVRMGSTATFHQSLEDGGLLSLRMG
jgi:hypothetical protein